MPCLGPLPSRSAFVDTAGGYLWAALQGWEGRVAHSSGGSSCLGAGGRKGLASRQRAQSHALPEDLSHWPHPLNGRGVASLLLLGWNVETRSPSPGVLGRWGGHIPRKRREWAGQQTCGRPASRLQTPCCLPHPPPPALSWKTHFKAKIRDFSQTALALTSQHRANNVP